MDFIYSLLAGLVSIVGPFVAKVLIALGVTFASYSGISGIVDVIKTNFFQAMGANGGMFLQLAGVLQLGTAFNMITSALIVRMTFNGMKNGGTITKLLFGGGAA
jgi:Protein of unknown function (DUF2523)